MPASCALLGWDGGVGGWGGHAEGINPAQANNHITKQFQHRCRNLLFLSQYWFSDNIVSLWIALASKTISGTISPCCVIGWHNFQHTHDIIITSACRWWILKPNSNIKLLLRDWTTAWTVMMATIISDYWRLTKALRLSWWGLAHWLCRLRLRLLANTLPNSADTLDAGKT